MKRKYIFLITVLMLLVVMVCAFAACDDAKNALNDLRVEEAEDIKYDGSYITWKKVNAEYYNVVINGGEAQRSNSTTFAYDAQDTTFEVVITSVLGESTATASKTFIPLSKIENDSVNISASGQVSWSKVDGATAYLVKVNGETLASPVTDTVYNQLKAGSNRISVKPIVSGDDSYYSKWSDDFNVFIYNQPSTLKYDGARLTWSGNASEYEVTINGTSQIVKGTTLDYNSGNADFEVSIKALGNHTTTYDSGVLTDSYHYLDTVTNMKVVDGVLTWDEVEGAEGYRISVNGVVQNAKITENRYALVSGQSLDIKLLPYNESGNYFSSWTDSRAFYVLKTPVTRWNNDLELDGQANQNYTWDAVDAAVGYTVLLYKDGIKQDTYEFSSIQRAFEYAYENVGVYEVSVKAVASKDDATYSDSTYSKPIRVERLAAPTKPSSNFIVSDPSSLAKGFTVTYVGVSGASGYQLYKDGVPLDGKRVTGYSISDSNVADSSIATQQNYTYSIRSMGGVKTVSGVMYVTLPCLSANALSFNIMVNAMPTGLSMVEFDAIWNAVPGSNGYSVSYGSAIVTANTERLDLSTLQAGLYDVAVCAKGNGSDTLASNYCAPVAVRRLSYPTNIKIVPGDGNGLLSFDSQNYATDYSVYVDLGTQPLVETNWDNMYDYITEKGTVISMTANANKYNEDNTLYYMSSPVSPTVQFIKLAAPVFPEGAISTNDALVWNASENINTAEYTPTYELTINNIAQQITNGTQFNLNQLEAGDYTVTVKAIGNSVKYLNSGSSLSFTFQKLATPEMTIDSAGYHWNSNSNVTSYMLEIDGKKVSDNLQNDGASFTYMPKYITAGEHLVRLIAVGNGINTVSSNPFVYKQQTQLLTAPTIEYSYSSESFIKNGSVTVKIITPNANASGYLYEIAGESVLAKETTRSKTIENPGVITIKVKTMGGTIDSNEIYYVDSVYTKEYTLILLATPNDSYFSMNGNGEILWNAVQYANGYDYQISIDDGEYGEIIHTGGCKIVTPISNYKNCKKITIKVRTSANGASDKVNSEWVQWTWVNPNL